MNLKCPAYPESCRLEFLKWKKILENIQIKENKWFIDIGASFGLVSFNFLVKNPSKIICFEPSVGRFNLLKYNTENSESYKLFEIFNKACSNKDETLEMVSSFANDNGGFNKTDYIDRSSSEGVREFVNCVDTYKFLTSVYNEEALIENLGFIKIDTEGHDYIILESLKPLLLKAKPILIIEWWHEININEKIFNVIKSIGYKALNSDTMEIMDSKDFYKKSENLILLPI